MKFAIVDLETTGGSPLYDRVVEIGIVLFEDGIETGRFQSLINPGIPIPFQVSLIHGINNEMVANQPSFEDLAEAILELTLDRIFVAHNVNFDFNFLKEEFKRIGQTFDRRKICSVRLAKKLLPELKSHSLKNLCRFYSIVNEKAHRALEDAVATTEILSRLLRKDNAEVVIKQLLNGKAGINLLPAHISYGRLETLPEVPGVYLFHDAKGKVLYVGKAINLRDRVKQHFSGHTHTKMKKSFLDSIHDLSFEIAGHELMALLMENELIKKHYPRYNSTNKDFRLNYGIFRFEDQKGFCRLVVGQTGKWSQPEIVFRTQEEATLVLLKTSMKFGLCLKLNQILNVESSKCTYENEKGIGCRICADKSDADMYNSYVDSAIEEAFTGKSIVLKTKGRTPRESGIVWIEKGKIRGTGFAPEDEDISDFTILKSYLKSYYDTQDAQSILRSYLDKARLIGKFPEGIPVLEVV